MGNEQRRAVTRRGMRGLPCPIPTLVARKLQPLRAVFASPAYIERYGEPPGRAAVPSHPNTG
jgi:hypothetical protein